MIQDDLPQLALNTLLRPLVKLLLPAADNDTDLARKEALAAVNAFNPKSEAEFRLGIRIAVFNIHANQALAEAATPDLPMNVVLRARQCAISLVREADKAERQLEKLQAAGRKENKPEPKTEPKTKPEPAPQPAATAPAIPVRKQHQQQEHRLATQYVRDGRLQVLADALAAAQPPKGAPGSLTALPAVMAAAGPMASR